MADFVSTENTEEPVFMFQSEFRNDENEHELLDIYTFQEHGMRYVEVPLQMTFPRRLVQLDSPEAVETTTVEIAEGDNALVWAYMPTQEGDKDGVRRLRAETFLPGRGIEKDHGDGSGGGQLAAALGSELIISHGDHGAIIYARPGRHEDTAIVGGRVVRGARFLIRLAGSRVSARRLDDES